MTCPATATLIHNLCDIASKREKYPLNVGPTGEGIIPQPGADRLKEIGAWMKLNGESIYGTSPTVFGAQASAFSHTETNRNGSADFKAARGWRCTTKPGKVYIHPIEWPAGKFDVNGLRNKAAKACLLARAAHTALEVKQTDPTVSVLLPQNAPDRIASVLCLAVVGKPGE
jgi:alpha-L-fucosidase